MRRGALGERRGSLAHIGWLCAEATVQSQQKQRSEEHQRRDGQMIAKPADLGQGPRAPEPGQRDGKGPARSARCTLQESPRHVSAFRGSLLSPPQKTSLAFADAQHGTQQDGRGESFEKPTSVGKQKACSHSLGGPFLLPLFAIGVHALQSHRV